MISHMMLVAAAVTLAAPADRLAVEAVARDYVDGQLEGDASRVARALKSPPTAPNNKRSSGPAVGRSRAKRLSRRSQGCRSIMLR
jgi:hypothetical protein